MIHVNGRRVDHVDGETVHRLLKRLKFTFPMIIVTIDGTLVQKDDYRGETILDGSRVEVLHIESGG